MSWINRLPLLPKHKGQRELVFVIALFLVIAGLGLVGGMTGVLYKDVPTSTPTVTVVPGTPSATVTP